MVREVAQERVSRLGSDIKRAFKRQDMSYAQTIYTRTIYVSCKLEVYTSDQMTKVGNSRP